MESQLFIPLKTGAFSLPNRIVMAPLTRGRADIDGVPTPLMADYYTQRAEAGLIIAEATAVSKRGYGWVQAPGIFTPAQVKGWQAVTEAMHKTGGRIVLQLWHMGRASHPDFLNGQLPVAPSAIAAKGHTVTPLGQKDYVVPHALEIEEIRATIADYRRAATLARDAGFDGVEIHAANGYLLDEFLRDGANKRVDAYGGPAENRVRFLQQVTEAVAGVWGGDRTGVRLSPRNPYKGMSDSDPVGTFCVAAEKLNAYGLAYLHVMEPLPGHRLAAEGERVSPHMRRTFKGVFIVNGGYTQDLAEKALENGEADAVAFGVPFIANPDLVARFRARASLNAPDDATFYTHDAKGYTDYPLMAKG
ncbi:MAG: alkene reductase [Alphaproteobacteria bacterium]|nr:alkene reductase [Alphaproteobacteria bacterium]